MSFARALFGATLAFTPLAGLSAQPLPVLGALEAGRWEIRVEGEPTRAMCMADPGALMQVRHGPAACSRLTIASDRGSATVHYSCPGAGWGRTTLRAASPRSVRIDTQGIADNAPFAYVAEAKKVGECGAMAAVLRR